MDSTWARNLNKQHLNACAISLSKNSLKEEANDNQSVNPDVLDEASLKT
jgi:hypothetical protein